MNQCEALYEPNKQDSTAAKGMAILAMAFLHLFCRTENLPYTPLAVIGKTPLIYYFGLFGDICVPVYCFISGYAQYLLREKEGKSFCKSIIKRLAKFYLGYLVVLILFTLIGLMSGSETIPVSFEKFIGNLFLAGMSYNGAWWFVLTYIFLVLLSPLLTGISKKTNPFLLISVSGAVYLAAYIFRFVHVISLPGKILPWIFTQLLLIGTSQFSFIAGPNKGFLLKKAYSYSGLYNRADHHVSFSLLGSVPDYCSDNRYFRADLLLYLSSALCHKEALSLLRQTLDEYLADAYVLLYGTV